MCWCRDRAVPSGLEIAMGRFWTRMCLVGLAALICTSAVSLAGDGDRGHSQEAVPRADHVHHHPGHRPERRRRRGDRRIDHQAGCRDPRLPADPARHRQGAVGGSRALQRLQPRALVRAVLRERPGRAERRADGRHRADGHRGRSLHRQAQPACLDVGHQRADLRREHPQGAGGARSGQRRGLQS